MMVHVGDIAGQDESAPEITSTLLTEIMTKGDVVTHTLSGEIGSLLAEGTLIPEAM
jgi:predicted amidohydrolase